MVLEGGPLRPEGILIATGEERTTCSSRTVPDDVLNLNPTGGYSTDVSRTERRVISCKSKERFGTWNVRSMYQGKLEVVKAEMIRIGVDLLGVSELRWKESGHFQSGDHQIMYSGGIKKRNGVAIICSRRMASSILGFNPVCDRIITARIRGNPINMTVVQVYAPTSEAEESGHEAFYETLQETLNSVPRRDIVVVMGDFNAKVGKGEGDQFIGRHGVGTRNEAGDRMHEFCAANDLVAVNTFFEQPPRRLYTWTSPDGQHRNQIDYIMIKARWKSSFLSVKTRPGADCGTDHELLIADFKMRLKRIRRDRLPTRYDLQNIPSSYNVEVRNMFNAINLVERRPEELWQEIKQGIKTLAKAHIPLQSRTKKNPWLSDTALIIASQRRTEKRNGNRDGIKELSKEFQRQARKDKEKAVADMCTEVEESNKQGRSRDLFKMIKKITGDFTARSGYVKSDNGKNLTEATEMKQRWKEYTEKLYRRDKNITLRYNKQPHTEEPVVLQSEVRRALKELSTNKAPGGDEIPIELIRD